MGYSMNGAGGASTTGSSVTRPSCASSPASGRELARGQFKSGLFMRHNSRGQAVWLEATYNPIRDRGGKVVKVVKFANDITTRIRAEPRHPGSGPPRPQHGPGDPAAAQRPEPSCCAPGGYLLPHRHPGGSGHRPHQPAQTSSRGSIEAIVSTISAIAIRPACWPSTRPSRAARAVAGTRLCGGGRTSAPLAAHRPCPPARSPGWCRRTGS